MTDNDKHELAQAILDGTRRMLLVTEPAAKELEKILQDFERQTIEKVLFTVLIKFYFADWTRACDYEKMTSEDVVNAAMAVCKEIEKEFNYDFDDDIMPDPFYDDEVE